MIRAHLRIPLGFAALFAACSSTPERIVELETARALVASAEASSQSGVAAAWISEARKALDRAYDLSSRSKDVDEIRYEARLASLNAEIANETILTAQAEDEITNGEAERQQLLLEERSREAERR